MASKTKQSPVKEKKIVTKTRQKFTYKNYEYLATFMSDRAKIIGRKRTGLSAKEQRKLALAVKHARHLGLLPYKMNI